MALLTDGAGLSPDLPHFHMLASRLRRTGLAPEEQILRTP